MINQATMQYGDGIEVTAAIMGSWAARRIRSSCHSRLHPSGRAGACSFPSHLQCHHDRTDPVDDRLWE